MSDDCFKLKGTNLAVFSLVVEPDINDSIFDQLTQKVEQAPHFFHQSPVVIDLINIEDKVEFQWDKLVDHCRKLEMNPIAFRNVSENLDISATGLSILPTVARPKEESVRGNTETASTAKTEIPAPTESAERSSTAKIVTRPVRSGQQVYAENRDLIILGQVSEGAEVIADGNIHIYGPLRGRALAGVKGDTEARIFCQNMYAELVAIAGRFLLSDGLDSTLTKEAVQIFLQGDNLQAEKI